MDIYQELFIDFVKFIVYLQYEIGMWGGSRYVLKSGTQVREWRHQNMWDMARLRVYKKFWSKTMNNETLRFGVRINSTDEKPRVLMDIGETVLVEWDK